ncbi:MAG: hypothetical protein WBX22_04765 [Silvibacterium sp.]
MNYPRWGQIPATSSYAKELQIVQGERAIQAMTTPGKDRGAVERQPADVLLPQVLAMP